MFSSLLSFSLPILTGILIVHLLWINKNNPIELSLKLFLGTGLGLGISSLLYFIYLFFFNASPYFLYIELALFFIILVITYLKHKRTIYTPAPRLRVNFLQIGILIIAGFVVTASFLGLANYSRQRAHGDWDAWMIYNRTARFIYRDQTNWQNAFSKDMDQIFHTDYPPLLALNTASRWDILNQESTYVPMFQGFLFSLAALGLMLSALASLKSLGQAGLGVILLAGVTFFLSEGGRQTADIPLAFYMLASIIFMFFYYHEKRPVFMVFAGLATGLAAWTKYEGLFFLIASSGILIVNAFRKRLIKDLYFYFLGLLLPLAILFYFKLQLARQNEFLSGGSSKMLEYFINASRHKTIVNYFTNFFLHSGGWNNIGIYLILFVYFVLFHTRLKNNPDVVFISLAIFVCQIMGYYVVYLITPNDILWQLDYSMNRLFMQIYPAIIFVVLTASQTPETVFASNSE